MSMNGEGAWGAKEHSLECGGFDDARDPSSPRGHLTPAPLGRGAQGFLCPTGSARFGKLRWLDGMISFPERSAMRWAPLCPARMHEDNAMAKWSRAEHP